ncbi:MAG: radical SAM peptide maturase, partial [bacterium]|nr:radical SAM peptide maturase [bacterium]
RNIYISFYGGEPLMNFPLMEKIIAYLDGFTTHHNRFVYTMTTNGLLLDKYADFLAQHNIRVLISLDGNEDNNSYRVSKSGDPLFSTIVENVGKLRDRYPDYFEKCVNFNAVFHNRNSVEDIHRFFKETFGKFPSVRELSTSGINEARKKEFWQMFANVDDSLKEAEDYSVIERDMLTKLPESENLSFFLQHNCSFTFHDYNALLAPENDCATLPTGTCFPFSKRLFVTAKGLLLPCERISFRHFFGEVKEGKVELDFEKLAARYNDMYSQVLPMCSRCFNNYACLQCLFHLSKDKDNSMNSCRGYMTAGDYLGGISGILSYVEENPDIYGNILKDVVVD